MLTLMDYAVNVLKVAKSDRQFLELIGCAPTNLSNIKKGRQGFSKDHIQKACEITWTSADYIFGFTSEIFRKKTVTGIDLLKQAVIAIEADLKGKKK